MKRLLALIGMLVFTLAGCVFGQTEPTTRFEDKKSVFYPISVYNYFVEVVGYEEVDGETYLLLYNADRNETIRAVVTERTKFCLGSDEVYNRRETGCKIEVVCEYNPAYYTDFYPLSYVWLVNPTQSTSET